MFFYGGRLWENKQKKIAVGRSLYGSVRYGIIEDMKRRKFGHKTANRRFLEIDELKGKYFIIFRWVR